jgi:cytoskeletal protein CcmA (bactofilin family)
MKGHACAVMIAAALTGGDMVRAQVQVEAAPGFLRNSYYAAGERIEVPAGVTGDVVVAGRTITVGQAVTGDILAAGWRITVTGDTADDVRIAGADVLVDSRIAGDLTVAGRDVTLGPRSTVTGNGWLTGQNVRIGGIVERELRVAAANVQIAGEIRRPTRIIAETLEVLPTARILAPVTYEGATPARIAAGALVTGNIAYRNIPSREAREARTPSGFSSFIFVMHLFVGGMLLFLVVPRFATAPAETLRAQPGRSFLTGLALAVVVPFLAVLFVVSLIGLPVGLVMGALYLAALFLAVLTTAFTLGNWEARLVHAKPITTRSRQALFLFAGVLTLAVLRALPLVGSVVVFFSIVFGLGALGIWAYRSYTHTAPAAAH